MAPDRTRRAGVLLAAAVLAVAAVALLLGAVPAPGIVEPTETAEPADAVVVVDGGSVSLEHATSPGRLDGERRSTATANAGQHASPPLVITDLAPRNATVASGENLTVNATVENDGDENGSQDVEFAVFDEDSSAVENESATAGPMPPGNNETVSFDVAADDLGPGTYDYTVATENDTANGTLTVQETTSIDVAVSLDVVGPAENVSVSLDAVAEDDAADNASAETTLNATRLDATVALGNLTAGAGNYTVVADASDYVANETTLAVENDSGSVDLSLERQTGSISGTVYDNSSGQGIENATVAVDYWNASDGVEERVQTDASGQYELADVPVGEHSLRGSATDYRNGSRVAFVTANESVTGTFSLEPRGSPDFDVTSLEPTYSHVQAGTTVSVNATVANEGDATGTQSVAIAVANASDDAVPNATRNVTLAPSESANLSFDVDTASLDAGEHRIEVATENDSRNATVTVARNATIEGDVALDVVDPGEAVTVEVRTNDSDAETNVSIAGGAENGSYALELTGLVQSQTVRVVANATNYTANETTLEVAPNETRQLDLDLRRANGSVAVNATAADGGEPVANATARLRYFGDADGPANETASLDEFGDATFADVPVGNHSLVVSAEGYENASRTVTVAANATANADVELLQNGTAEFGVNLGRGDVSARAGDDVTLNATVTNEGDASGAANATFTLAAEDGTDVRSDTESIGELDAGASDTVAFDVPTDGLDAGEYEYEIAAGNASANGTVTVLREALVSGSVAADVVDPDEAVTVEVRVDGANASTNVTLDGDGDSVSYNLSGIYVAHSQEATVVANASDYLANTTTVDLVPNESVTENLSLERLTGSVEGTVSDDGGDGIEGATVELHTFGNETTEPFANATTGASGAFDLEEVPVGRHTLAVDAVGYQNTTVGVDVAADQPTSVDADLVALDSSDIQIETLAPGDRTVDVGQTVTLNATVVNAGDANGTETVTLNVTGPDRTLVDRESLDVELAPNQTESVTLELDTSGRESGDYDYVAAVGNDTDDGTIKVRADGGLTANISLDVVDPSADANVTVQVRNSNNGSVADERFVELTRSDQNEMATFDGLDAGNYTVVANASSYVENSTDVEVLANEIVATNLTLMRETGSVSGTVTGDGGDPVESATVELAPFGDEASEPLATTTTNSNGEYRFDSVPVGEHTLVVGADDYQNDTTDVGIESNLSTSEDVDLVPLYSPDVQVQSLEPGDVIVDPGAVVSLNATFTNEGKANATDSVDLHVVSVDSGFAESVSKDVNLAPGETASIAWDLNTTGFEAGEYQFTAETGNDTSSGTITVNAVGTLTTGVALDVVDPDGDVAVGVDVRSTDDDSVADATVDLAGGQSNGTVTFDSLGTGNYTVVANATDYLATETTATVTPGDTVEANLSLQRHTGSVNVTVVNESDDRVENATVELHAFGDEESEPFANATTVANGTFRFDGVPVGTHSVAVSVNGSANATTNVTVAANDTATANLSLGDESDGGEDDSGGDDNTGGGLGPAPSPTPDPSPAPQPEPDLELRTVTPTDATVPVGEPVVVTAVVANEGDAAGETTLAVRVGAETIATDSVSVAANGSQTREFTVETADREPDVYRLEVEGAGEEVAGALYVTEQSVDDSENGFVDADNETGTGDGQPGFGVRAALVALLALGCLGWRRRGAA